MDQSLQCLKTNNSLDGMLMNFVCASCSPGEWANACASAKGSNPTAVIVPRASFHRPIAPPNQMKALNIISIEDG